MTPLESNPFRKPSPREDELARQEIRAFIEHECEFAELPMLKENVSLQTNMERYKKACRQLHILDLVDIRTTKGRIIACKRKINSGGNR